MRQPPNPQLAAIKVALFIACLMPLSWLTWRGVNDALGANPVESVTRSTGWWALFLLCATLAATPLRVATGAAWLIRLRRMLGLFAFFYAALHFTTYIWLDVWFDPAAIAKDIFKRPFITVGFTAFVLLVPLAASSTAAMQRRLGRNWQRLHRSVYVIGILGVTHYWWLVKRDIREPIVFALVLTVLFASRLLTRMRNARQRGRAPRVGASAPDQARRTT